MRINDSGVRVLASMLAMAATATACKSSKEGPSATPPAAQTLLEARSGFVTRTHDLGPKVGPAPAPPPSLFSLVHYASPAGALAAYVTPRPADGARHPAIVWIAGGIDSSIDETAWMPASPDNDQSARAFRDLGIVLMLPSLRGGNDNPGERESFYGEVDDVIAAGDFVSHLDYVDPTRVYLGGHSTGGTLVLLVAEATQRFRAVFAFGAVASVAGYGPDNLAIDPADKQEVRLRSPMYFTAAIKTPTWILEGADPPSNARALPLLMKSAPPALHAIEVPGFTHFSILAPATHALAEKILADVGPSSSIVLSADELARRHAR